MQLRNFELLTPSLKFGVKIKILYVIKLGLSDRARPGQPWVRQGQAKSDPLAFDPMRARPDHQNPVPTLALPLDSV